jgi:hypothetical protein
MQAVKALYKNGKIELLEPLTDIEEAELCIIVLDKNKKNNDIPPTMTTKKENEESEFKAIGLASYFAADEDNEIDWEEVFDV